MRVSINSSEGVEILNETFSFQHIDDQLMVRDRTRHYDHNYIKGVVREISFDGVFIAHSMMEMGNPVRAHFINEGEYITMHFMLKGHSHIKDKNSKRTIKILPNTHDIVYINGVEGYTETVGMPVESFEIVFLPEFYNKYFPFDSPALQRLRNSIDKSSNYEVLSNHYMALNYEIHQVIHHILGCSYTGGLKKLFLESKVMELLILQIESLSARKEISTVKWQKSETERLYAVKEFIENNLNETCRLIDIAHQFQTNEVSLNTNFKKVFGSTVYQYWLDCRLKKAAYLIEYNHLNINEVAFEIGYKNAQHFTAAFKRKFGYLPSSLKEAN